MSFLRSGKSEEYEAYLPEKVVIFRKEYRLYEEVANFDLSLSAIFL